MAKIPALIDFAKISPVTIKVSGKTGNGKTVIFNIIARCVEEFNNCPELTRHSRLDIVSSRCDDSEDTFTIKRTWF